MYIYKLYAYHFNGKVKQKIPSQWKTTEERMDKENSFKLKVLLHLSFLLRLQNHLEILKQSYTAANKSRQFFSIYGNLL